MRAKPGVKGARDVPVAQGGLRGRGRVRLSRSRKDDDARATPGSARVTGGVAAARSEARSAGSAQQLGTRTAGTRARRACTENALIQAALLNRVAVSPPNCRALEASPAGHVAARSAPRRPATPRDTPQHPATPRASPPARPAAQGKHPRQARVPVRPFGEPRVRRRAVPRGSAREVWPGRPSFLHEHKWIKLIRKAFDELLSLGCIILETIRIKCMFYFFSFTKIYGCNIFSLFFFVILRMPTSV